MAALCAAFTSAGCSLRLTAGFGPGVLAKLDGDKITTASALLLMGESVYSYEKLFDSGVWSKPMGEVTAEEYVKASVKDTLMHLKYLKLMAKEMKLTVSESEAARLDAAAGEYWDSLPAVSEAGFDKGTVREFYEDLLLAEKVFYAATSQVDTEVSADEARVIDVQYIFISTSVIGEDGEPLKLSGSELQKKKALGDSLVPMAAEGDFAALAREYSDDSEYSLQFGTGEKDADFERAAFSLEMGEVSGLVETEYGYYIIKCINDNAGGSYDRRREEIILARRTEAFAEYYSDFTAGIEMEFNDSAYDKLDIKKTASGSGRLYEIFNKNFVSTQSN